MGVAKAMTVAARVGFMVGIVVLEEEDGEEEFGLTSVMEPRCCCDVCGFVPALFLSFICRLGYTSARGMKDVPISPEAGGPTAS